MARRQLQIAGTERTDIPDEVDEAGEKWLELRKETRRATERTKEAKQQLIALMGAFKVPKFHHKDPDTGENILLTVDLEPKLRAKKTGENEDTKVGDGVAPSGRADSGPGVPEGLIAQAQKAQSDNGVEENEEGDVVPPEKSKAKPKKRKGK
jgi:hypothetical protein